MEYISTRGMSLPTTSAGAIRQGMAPDGGLYVPVSIPAWSGPDSLIPASYQERAAWLLAKFLADYTPGEIASSVAAAYSKEKFRDRCSCSDGDFVHVLGFGIQLAPSRTWPAALPPTMRG